uniref:PE-PGRS family protein n=1 Tax=Parastrongyloides trichosuri TaxID=131310 RepID=A0A0N4ZL18_PARTI
MARSSVALQRQAARQVGDVFQVDVARPFGRGEQRTPAQVLQAGARPCEGGLLFGGADRALVVLIGGVGVGGRAGKVEGRGDLPAPVDLDALRQGGGGVGGQEAHAVKGRDLQVFELGAEDRQIHFGAVVHEARLPAQLIGGGFLALILEAETALVGDVEAAALEALRHLGIGHAAIGVAVLQGQRRRQIAFATLQVGAEVDAAQHGLTDRQDHRAGFRGQALELHDRVLLERRLVLIGVAQAADHGEGVVQVPLALGEGAPDGRGLVEGALRTDLDRAQQRAVHVQARVGEIGAALIEGAQGIFKVVADRRLQAQLLAELAELFALLVGDQRDRGAVGVVGLLGVEGRVAGHGGQDELAQVLVDFQREVVGLDLFGVVEEAARRALTIQLVLDLRIKGRQHILVVSEANQLEGRADAVDVAALILGVDPQGVAGLPLDRGADQGVLAAALVAIGQGVEQIAVVARHARRQTTAQGLGQRAADIAGQNALIGFGLVFGGQAGAGVLGRTRRGDVDGAGDGVEEGHGELLVATGEDAVDEHADRLFKAAVAARTDAANGDQGGAARLADAEVRDLARQFVEVRQAEAVQGLAADHVDRDRHVLQGFLLLLRGDDDVVERAGDLGLRRSGRVLGIGQTRRQQGGGHQTGQAETVLRLHGHSSPKASALGRTPSEGFPALFERPARLRSQTQAQGHDEQGHHRHDDADAEQDIDAVRRRLGRRVEAQPGHQRQDDARRHAGADLVEQGHDREGHAAHAPPGLGLIGVGLGPDQRAHQIGPGAEGQTHAGHIGEIGRRRADARPQDQTQEGGRRIDAGHDQGALVAQTGGQLHPDNHAQTTGEEEDHLAQGVAPAHAEGLLGQEEAQHRGRDPAQVEQQDGQADAEEAPAQQEVALLGQGLVAVALGAAFIRREQAGDQGRDEDRDQDEAAGGGRLDGDARPDDLLGHGGRAEGAEDAQDDRDLTPAEQLGQGARLGGDGGGPGLMRDQSRRIGRRGQHGRHEQIGRPDQGLHREEQQADRRQENRQGDPDPRLVLLLEMAAVDGQTDQGVHDDVDQTHRQQDGPHGRQRQTQALRIQRRHET